MLPMPASAVDDVHFLRVMCVGPGACSEASIFIERTPSPAWTDGVQLGLMGTMFGLMGQF